MIKCNYELKKQGINLKQDCNICTILERKKKKTNKETKKKQKQKKKQHGTLLLNGGKRYSPARVSHKLNYIHHTSAMFNNMMSFQQLMSSGPANISHHLIQVVSK